jgi:hypothetical protein
MSTKEQFKMYLDPEMIERLDRLAEKNGRRSSQQVAEEIIAIYLPVWTAVTDAANRAISYQTQTQPEPKFEAFDLDAKIREGGSPDMIMSEWFTFEGRETPSDFGMMFFKGWETYSPEEKLAALNDAKRILDRTLTKTPKQKKLAPKGKRKTE